MFNKKKFTVEFETTLDVKKPLKGHLNDAGVDFHSPIDLVIQPKEIKKINLGVKWKPINIPKNKIAMIDLRGRSGLAFKHHIFVPQNGTIDEGYSANIYALLYNAGEYPYKITKGDAIVQGVIHLIEKYKFDSKKEGSRSNNGFGSTGR